MKTSQLPKSSLASSNPMLNKVISILLIGLIITFSITLNAQVDKNAVALKNAQTALDKANANLAKVERQIATADSLIEVGTTQESEAKSEIKQLETDKKSIDKEYNSLKKPLDKRVNGKDKEDATAARTELKELDTKYRADVKANTTAMTAANKKLTTGTGNINKGKTSKKSAETSLKMANTKVEDAQAKLDKLNGAGDN